MYEASETGPKIIIIAMATLFGLLFLIFLYYIWAEKFGGKTIYDKNSNPESNFELTRDIVKHLTTLKPNATNDMGLDNESLPAVPNVAFPANDNSIALDASDPNYVPPGFKMKPGAKPKKQVFNVGNNIYTYGQAEAVCKAFDSKLATYPQLVKAYKSGADWCNYGWTKGKLALYPTQKASWLKLQDDPETRNSCGKVGINGGYFENPDMLFGVNCYGIKPSPRDHEKVKYQQKSKKEYELEQQVAKIKRNIDNLSINPFNKSKWSNC